MFIQPLDEQTMRLCNEILYLKQVIESMQKEKVELEQKISAFETEKKEAKK